MSRRTSGRAAASLRVGYRSAAHQGDWPLCKLIAERMREYHKLTEAVLDHYRKRGVRVVPIDGTGGVDDVFERIRAAVGISSR